MFLNLDKKIIFFIATFALAESKALAKTDNNDYICKNAVVQKDGTIHCDEVVFKNRKEYDKEKEKNKSESFVKKYIFPDYNPAFAGDNPNSGHAVGFQVGYDMTRFIVGGYKARLGTVAFQYSAGQQWLGVNGRTSVGIFSILGYDPLAIEKGKGSYRQLGFELIQEFVVGTKDLYLTCGVGLSWLTTNTSYASKKNTEHYGKNEKWDGMTNFNIPVTASIGHRFDNGMVAELTWKHYSNGHIGHYNHQVNNFGMSVRYTF